MKPYELYELDFYDKKVDPWQGRRYLILHVINARYVYAIRLHDHTVCHFCDLNDPETRYVKKCL